MSRTLTPDSTLEGLKKEAKHWLKALRAGDAHAIDVARELLDRGADSNARFDDGWGNPFTILTGIIGEGEGDRPPHPHAAALAALLIDRGANPYDTQSMYNTSITRDDTRWLEFLWLHSEKRGVLDDWLQVPQPKLGGRIPLNALDYLLGNAVAYNHLRRAAWMSTSATRPSSAASRMPSSATRSTW